MRIAIVADWYFPRVGGIEGHARELATRLAARGHEVTVVTAWPGPDEVDGIPVIRLPVTRIPFLWGASLSPALVPMTQEIFRPGRFDVMHGHHSCASPACMASMYAADRAGIPVVVTWHSVIGPYRILYHLTALVFGWRRWRFRVMAVSELVAGHLRRIMPTRPVGLIPNAVDTGDWAPTAHTPVPGRLRLASVGRLHSRKRVWALLWIIFRLRRRLGDEVEVTLEVLGDGPGRRSLERAARLLGLADAVTFLGRGDQETVRALLRRTDLFVNACVQEAFGIAGLEATASGVPVVARAEGGSSAYVRSGRNGVLVRSDREMLDVLEAFARSPERLARLQRIAATESKEPYSWEGSIRRHEELYAEVLEHSGVVACLPHTRSEGSTEGQLNESAAAEA